MKHIIKFNESVTIEMRYLKLFENYKKAESILKKYEGELSSSQLATIDTIKKSVKVGYIGKIIELYLKDQFDYVDSDTQLKYILYNINSVTLSKSIDLFYTIDDISKEIKKFKTIKLLNKIKKSNNIKIDIDRVVDFVLNNNIDLTDIDKLPIHGGVKSEQDIINLLSGTYIKNLEYHKDWDILYEDDKILIYEILSYQGAMYLIHVNQCIRSEATYNSYVESGFRFFNIINKNNINDSIFIDQDSKKKLGIFKWNGEVNTELEKDSRIDNFMKVLSKREKR